MDGRYYYEHFVDGNLFEKQYYDLLNSINRCSTSRASHFWPEYLQKHNIDPCLRLRIQSQRTCTYIHTYMYNIKLTV
jgi:hypothetical protein